MSVPVLLVALVLVAAIGAVLLIVARERPGTTTTFTRQSGHATTRAGADVGKGWLCGFRDDARSVRFPFAFVQGGSDMQLLLTWGRRGQRQIDLSRAHEVLVRSSYFFMHVSVEGIDRHVTAIWMRPSRARRFLEVLGFHEVQDSDTV